MSISITNVMNNLNYSISRSLDHQYFLTDSEPTHNDLISSQYYFYRIDVENCDYKLSLSLIPDLRVFLDYSLAAFTFVRRSNDNPKSEFYITFEIMGTDKEMNDFYRNLICFLNLKSDIQSSASYATAL